jgi:hypothetical protein
MLILALLVAAPAQDGRTMATDDWNPMTITAVGATGEGPFYLDVHAGDLDGDGLPDDAYLKLICADGKLQQALYQVKGPRDSASGMATGKRMHKPLVVVKGWDPATKEMLAARPTYDLKKGTKARMAASGDDWTPLDLSSGDALCSALAAQRVVKTKTKSNQSND